VARAAADRVGSPESGQGRYLKRSPAVIWDLSAADIWNVAQPISETQSSRYLERKRNRYLKRSPDDPVRGPP
jgi:hypothetical protein